MVNSTDSSIRITIDMKTTRIDLDVTNPIPVEELFSSLRRAGITHLQCLESSGQENQNGFDEVLILEAVLHHGP